MKLAFIQGDKMRLGYISMKNINVFRLQFNSSFRNNWKV